MLDWIIVMTVWAYLISLHHHISVPPVTIATRSHCVSLGCLAGPGMGADLVSHEATFSAGMEKKAHVAQHSTAPMAGAFARKIRAKALVLTHFSNRYSNKGEMQGEQLRSESEGDRQDVLRWLTNQAKEAYGSDRVWAADDFYTFQVRRGPTRAVAGYAHAQTPGNTARRAETN